MSNSGVGYAVLGIGVIAGAVYLLSSRNIETAQKKETLLSGGELVNIGQGVPVEVSTLGISELDEKGIIRTAQPRGEVSTFKFDIASLSSGETRALAAGLYDIDEKAQKIEYGIIPSIQRKLRESKNVSLAPLGFKETRTTIQYTPKVGSVIKPTEIKKQDVSSLDSKNISRIISSSGQITTYKGTKTQIAIGKTIDKFKSIFKKKK